MQFWTNRGVTLTRVIKPCTDVGGRAGGPRLPARCPAHFPGRFAPFAAAWIARFPITVMIINGSEAGTTEREIKAAIYLAGAGGNLRVVHDIAGERCEIAVPNAPIGNAIVRALRNRQRNAAGRGGKA